MCPNSEHCRREFSAIHNKLDRLDESLRGNGKPGVLRRLDRLESVDATRSKMTWLIVGSVVVLAVGALWKLFFGA